MPPVIPVNKMTQKNTLGYICVKESKKSITSKSLIKRVRPKVKKVIKKTSTQRDGKKEKQRERKKERKRERNLGETEKEGVQKWRGRARQCLLIQGVSDNLSIQPKERE